MVRNERTIDFFDAGSAYLAQGATEVHVVLSHLACNDRRAFDRLLDSPIKTVIATNSHPMSQETYVAQSGRGKFVILDVSGLFADIIRKILE